VALKGSYWLDDATLPEGTAAALPAAVDVLIIGAGYTGLSAARETSLAGLSTLVLDRGLVGSGCSGLNGGQVAYSFKPSLVELSARHGADLGFRVAEEAKNALVNLRRLAEQERLDCDWQPRGSFYGAHTARHFERIVRDAESQPRGLEQRITVVPRADVGQEVDSPLYHGGAIYHDDASVHPAKLLNAVYRRAVEAGATIAGRCAVTGLERSDAGFVVATERGTVRAGRVLVATNGYTSALTPWHRRRVIPIGSYQIATEELGAERVRALIPNLRNVGDTRRVIIYLRPSPDGKRILFGGRAALCESDAARCVPRLQAMLAEVFPSLAGVASSHAWMGFIAYTFDAMPHLGNQDGLYYCLGYCGQGVPTATYFGMRIGQQMAGRAEGRTALDGLSFSTRPLYYGNPWFLAPSILTYRLLDRLGV
jgi:glycine/D-amino acid oxidase-like deaminating enzyme